MPRRLSLYITCAFALVFCLPGHAQDSPSLGDLARQAQKDKSNAPSKKVFTNDDLPPGSGSDSLGPTGGLGQFGQPASLGTQGGAFNPSAALDRLEATLDKVASLDRDTLVKNIL